MHRHYMLGSLFLMIATACSDPGTGLRGTEFGGLEEPPLVPPTTYAALLYGQVLNADGSPASNVVVWLVGAERSATCRTAPDPWLEATTDAEGRYRLWAYTSAGENAGVCVNLLAQAGMSTPPVIASQTPVRPTFRIYAPYDSVRLNGVLPERATP